MGISLTITVTITVALTKTEAIIGWEKASFRVKWMVSRG